MNLKIGFPAICDLGYSCTFLENGAIIFQKEVNEK